MVKTELGCQVLHDKGHFSDFTHFIRQHGFDSEDSDIILKLKSVLWAVVSTISSIDGLLTHPNYRAISVQVKEEYHSSKMMILSQSSLKWQRSHLSSPFEGM